MGRTEKSLNVGEYGSFSVLLNTFLDGFCFLDPN